ncbi:hypothetical protein BSKO_02895 [Bryopsis sp. KO-2023]|nr:hypothetical protein BSKO_02895 [Bryopsis sp. KO-2023]
MGEVRKDAGLRRDVGKGGRGGRGGRGGGGGGGVHAGGPRGGGKRGLAGGCTGYGDLDDIAAAAAAAAAVEDLTSQVIIELYFFFQNFGPVPVFSGVLRCFTVFYGLVALRNSLVHHHRSRHPHQENLGCCNSPRSPLFIKYSFNVMRGDPPHRTSRRCT